MEWLNSKGRRAYYSVAYFDAIEGGSGMTTVPCDELHKWLKEHPGYLIRALSPNWLED